MNVTRRAGRSLTVEELRDALSGAHRNDPVRIVVAGEPIEVESVIAVTASVEIHCATHPVDSAALYLLVEIAEGAYTLKQAKIQAAGILRRAGIEVEA